MVSYEVKPDFMKLTYNKLDDAQPTEIYLARPGQRVIGRLNGVEQDSVDLQLNLNNCHVLSFTVDRIVNGEISSFYDKIERHSELFLTGYGWFKINEQPEVSNDGDVQKINIRAESLEIELQQYDLTDFRVNMGTVDSREMLATDNIYYVDGDKDYRLPRDNVRFWRDTSGLQELIQELPDDGTFDDLIKLSNQASPGTEQENKYEDIHKRQSALLNMWRIEFDPKKYDDVIRSAVKSYKADGYDTTMLEKQIGVGKSDYDFHNLCNAYPRMMDYLVVDNSVKIDLSHNDPDEKDQPDYTVKEVLKRELKRQKELSLLSLVLEAHDWHVGEIDMNRLTKEESALQAGGIETNGLLMNQVGKFDANNKDIYSFLTQDVEQENRCIFTFDTQTRNVNAYRVESIGVDTNIFLSFHNIQNSVSRTSDEPLYTVYTIGANVSDGSEVNPRQANCGDSQIEDLSWFMNTEHFEQSTINKYNTWVSGRETLRKEYMQKAVKYRKAVAKAQQIYSRVPNDAADPKQYSTFTNEELANERMNQLAMFQGLKSYYVKTDEFDADGKPVFDQEACLKSPDGKDYILLRDIILSNPLDAFCTDLDYKKIIANGEDLADITVNYKQGDDSKRLGQIDRELYRRYRVDKASVQESIEPTHFDEDYIYNLEKYGDNYGVDELKNLQQTWTNELQTLTYYRTEKQPVLDRDGKQMKNDDGSLMFQTPDAYYTERHQRYVIVTKALATCKTVLAKRQKEYDDAETQVSNISKEMGEIAEQANISNSKWNFTPEQLTLLDRYRIHTDYQQADMITTKLSSPEDIVNKQNELLSFAYQDLYATAHPQWKFQTTQDNLILLSGFRDWVDELQLGNYLRVGFREDDDFQTGLPDYDNQTQLRLIGVSLNPFLTDTTIGLTFSTMIQYRSKRNDFVALLGSSGGAAKNSIQYGSVSGQADPSVNVNEALLLKLLGTGKYGSYQNAISAGNYGGAAGMVTDALNNLELSADRIKGLTDKFQTLADGYIDLNYINTKMLHADQASIKDLSANVLNAINANIKDLNADYGNFYSVISDHVQAKDISADTIVAKLASLDTVQAQKLFADNIFTQHIDAEAASAAKATINDAYIRNLVSQNITVGDLKGGDIELSDKMKIVSKDSNLVMNSKALQIFKENDQGEKYGVQLGFDQNDEPSLIIKDDDGTAMFTSRSMPDTPKGIQLNAISDKLITPEKLSVPIVQANEYGGVDISQIYDGSGGKFGTEYNSFKQGVNDNLAEINNTKKYQVRIESDNGNIFKNGEINCTLSCRVFSWDDEVTDDINAAAFHWKRKSKDAEDDEKWNTNHSSGKKTITLTPDDVWGRSVFFCTVELPDGTTETGS